ncbi:MAG: toll/interleukin-1 receptor domain-containing protein [Bacteroidota bacterium]|nr:toll/interleukin-1 receptor domain-containing protein [Bacteroidota bacterium]
MRQDKYEYDAFISHAVEDKIPIANELCARLEMAGLRIWYSGKELGVGDSIEKTIAKGLNRSRYGIVIFSPTYLAKNWTIREFYTLLAKEIEEHKVILPVLYNIELDDLKNKDLLMADRFAVNADRGLDFVVERLVREIRKPEMATPKVAWFSRMWLFLGLSLLINVALVMKSVFPDASEESLRAQRVAEIPARPQIMTSGLFTEMQGLVSQLNHDSCPCRDERRPSPAPAGLIRNDENGLRMDPREADQPRQQERPKAGSKMTMAVVFQIENMPERAQPIENKMDDITGVINLEDQQDRFVTVSNREYGAGTPQHECTHHSHLAD